MSSKKIMLFIVEGVTDEESLGLILSRLLNTRKVRSRIVGCEVTLDVKTPFVLTKCTNYGIVKMIKLT